MALPFEIIIESELHSPAELKEALTLDPTVTATKELPESSFRMDPTVLVALIGGSAQVLGAVIAAVAALPAKKKPGSPPKARIWLSDGRSVEVPADLAPERVKSLVALLENKDAARIRVTAD
jgi:hypothetical protein